MPLKYSLDSSGISLGFGVMRHKKMGGELDANVTSNEEQKTLFPLNDHKRKEEDLLVKETLERQNCLQ